MRPNRVISALILLLWCYVGRIAWPQVPASDRPSQVLQISLEQVTSIVAPAVVHIEVVGYGRLGDEDSSPKNQTLTREHGSGSGVIVSSDGYIITAYHVIEGARRVRVALNGDEQSESLSERKAAVSKSLTDAKIVGGFKEADIAVLKIDGKDLPTIPIADPASLKHGQIVAAFGSPEGLRDSVSMGVISAVSRQIEPDDFMSYIQTDASQASGSSGGPLVNMKGELVGIVVFNITDRGKHEGLGFAVPSGMVDLVYQQVRKSGVVRRASLGCGVQGITPILAAALKLPVYGGVIVTDTNPETSCEKEGLKSGDVLLKLNGAAVHNMSDLNWELLHKVAGDRINIEAWRKTGLVMENITLVQPRTENLDPLALENVDEYIVSKLGIVASVQKPTNVVSDHSAQRVTVLARLRGTANEVEFSEGDVIRSVNGTSVNSLTHLRGILDEFKPGDPVAIEVERNGTLMYVAFEID
jgi:serine protease Do